MEDSIKMKSTFGTKLMSLKATLEKSFKKSLINNDPPAKELKENSIPSLKELKGLTERMRLSSFMPYESFDSQNDLYFNKDTLGFMLIGQPATGLGLTDLKILNGIFSQLHAPDTSIQISIISDTNIEGILETWSHYKENAADLDNREIFKTLTQNRVKYFKEGKWSSLFKDQPLLLRNYQLVISYTVPLSKEEYSHNSDVIEELKRMRSTLTGTLRSAKIWVENLYPERFINLMNAFINPSAEKQPYLHYDPNESIARQIVDEDTLVLFNSGTSSIVHKDKSYSVIPYHVRQYPQRWAGYRNGELIGSSLNNILRIPCPFVLTLSVLVPDQLTAKGLVKAKFTRATQMADSPISKYATQWKERKRDWEYTHQKVEQGEKLLKSFYQIILLTPEGKEQECEQSLLSIYESLGWILSKSRYTPMHSFLGALPMGLDLEGHKAMNIFGHYTSKLSWNCTHTAPWIGEWKGTKNPMLLLLGRRGQIVYFNPFDNDKGNFNVACPATSGSGKSFITLELVFSCLGAGGRVFIIDSGHSYRNLCQLLKGTYIDFGQGRPNLNPFSKIFDKENMKRIEQLARENPLSKDNPDGYSLDDYKNDFMPMLTELLGQMASQNNPLDERHKACLEKAISAAIDEYQEKTTITKVAEKCLELKDSLGSNSTYAEDVALMLHAYTKDGMYGRYFEGPNNINLDNNFIVLELDALNSKGALQSVVLLILMIQINQMMYLSGNKKQIKQVIIDEAWRLLGSGRAGKFIEEGYRVARKHGGSYMTITQKISDYFTSDTAKAAFMNSDYVLYLRQKPEELSSAEKLGHIDNSDGKVDLLKTLETIQGKYSELAISSPDGISVVRFCVDPITEKIYSTKGDEVDFIRNAQSQGASLFEAVNELLKNSESRK